ncbi:TRAP transporter substrate-binding protein [Vreelandella neptunia]|jgi:tripartite ATP-independent transporter DctP family solute receptor|uniref:TRAP transporter substrate-binding protein n=1 Tax=Vreelandella neptunia TaxID=115551 RepID=A0ABS9SBZ4_9GAMM|nr:TRAP transporter substrate-binding protein [Halomonas neptunia]MCH4813638.1 TRAP transporter substrate-binding protein [Halomonas neptunia]|tara:strand:+ start:1991 stop:3007 length:1017 start_codon:yes stop_codon:yes gene_type:complete
MKKAKSFLTAATLTLSSGAMMVAAANAQAATSLRLAHTFNPGEASYELLNTLGDRVEERTNGELKIQVFPSEQLGSEVQLLQQSKNGSVDIVVPGYSGASTLLPAMEISNAPFIFQSWDEARHILEGEAYQPIFDELKEQHNLVPLAKTWYWGWRNLTFNGDEVHSVEDMKGLKVRVPESPAWVEMVKAFDASPTPIPFSEVYLALQQGTVDGQENPIPTIYSRKFYEVQDQLVMSKHMLQSQVVLMNSQKFESLSDSNQEILREVVQELAQENYELQTEREASMLEELRAGGQINVIEDIDRASFEQASEQARENLVDRWGEEDYRRVMTAIEDYRN